MRWRSRLAIDGREPNERAKAMRDVNPAFIPRNHRVEQALDAALDNADFSPFVELLAVLSRPYQDQSAFAEYANPPQTGERVFRTFCGT
jgi:serine/tyrosine/threonine adenylyltransferase